MTNPKKKPAKGVPMPSLGTVECFWIEDADGLFPGALLKQINIQYESTDSIVRDIARARKWLANPQQPKGVGR